MKRLIQIFATTFIIGGLVACGGGETEKNPTEKEKTSLGSKKKKKEKKEEKSEGIDPMSTKGVGPITNLELGELDEAMVAEGKELYDINCTACHKIDKKFVGPALKGITQRRTPEWVMNMILNPEEMIKKDPLAKQVMIDANMAIMANQSLTEDQARKIYEYFRTL